MSSLSDRHLNCPISTCIFYWFVFSALIVQWLGHLVVAEETWVRFPLGARTLLNWALYRRPSTRTSQKHAKIKVKWKLRRGHRHSLAGERAMHTDWSRSQCGKLLWQPIISSRTNWTHKTQSVKSCFGSNCNNAQIDLIYVQLLEVALTQKWCRITLIFSFLVPSTQIYIVVFAFG